MRRYANGAGDATARQNLESDRTDPTAQQAEPVSLVAHGGADLINTWGFAYVGGIIGLFSLSLLYVKAKVDQRTDQTGATTLPRAVASLGPAVIVVGGVCGVSLGLGIAGLLDSAFESAEVDDVVAELCDLRTSGPTELPPALHDDILHVIDDNDLAAAEPRHSAFDAVAALPQATPQEWATTIDQLAAALVSDDQALDPVCRRDGS